LGGDWLMSNDRENWPLPPAMRGPLLEPRDDIAAILYGSTAGDNVTDQQAYLKLTHNAIHSLRSKMDYVERLFYDKYLS